MDIYQNQHSDPTFIILDIHFIHNELMSNIRSLNINQRDIEEIYWQVILNLFTFDDLKTEDRLKQLPDFSRLSCANKILANEQYEKLIKRSFLRLGMDIHELVRNLGLYDYDRGFNFTIKELTPYKLVLRKLLS